MPHLNLEDLIRTVGYVGLIAIVFAESGLLIGFFLPGDSLLFTAGFLASQGYLNIAVLAGACFVAAVAGDAVGYAFGRRVGPALFRRDDSLFFRRQYLVRAEEFFARHGGKAIVLARFLPVVRTFTPIVAGAGKMHYPRFAVFNALGGFLWAVGMTFGGYFLGSAIPNVDRYLLPIIFLIILVSVAPTAIHIWRQNGREIRLAVRQQVRRYTARR
jgi:membrane-associated protein